MNRAARSEPVRLIVERDAAALERTRVFDAPALVLPLETTRIDVALDDGPVAVGRSALAALPAGYPLRMMAPRAGSVAVVVLVVGPRARAAAIRDYAPHVTARGFAEVIARPRLLPRTRWVDEIVQRYRFEREVCERHRSRAARFLEIEVAKELYFLGRDQLDRQARAALGFVGGELIARARAELETHLFEEVRVGELARRLGASESTLLRAFRREVGETPAAYLRRRRLEEAMALLEAGRLGVTEVASRVGYDTPSAFAAAFRAAFGMAPSEARPRPPTRPPHGAPPVRRPRRRG